jgi:hypothetical protein
MNLLAPAMLVIQNEESSNFPLVLITQLEVYNIFHNLNPWKASGPDGIPNWLLRDYAELLTLSVCFVLNCSYQEMKLPTIWKYANVAPKPKLKPVTITLISISDQFL